METIESNGSLFYIDPETTRLSGLYNVCTYKGPAGTLKEANTEFNTGRLLFLSRMCGQIVGTGLDSYLKEYPGEKWFDRPVCISQERNLKFYLEYASKVMKEEAGRIVKLPEKKVFFPTEALVKKMLKGREFVPPSQHLSRYRWN